MALVSYDFSSESDDNITDEEEEVTTSRAVIKEPDAPVVKIVQETEVVNGDSQNWKPESGLFSHLPRAKLNLPKISEEDDQLEDFIPTVKSLKEKKKVQITIPSLSEFEDLSTEEPLAKRPKPSEKGSGLLSILPPVQTVPKSSTMFVPNTVQKKSIPTKPATTSKAVTSKTAKNVLRKSKPPATAGRTLTESGSDTDGEDIPVPDTFDDQMWEKVCGRSKPAPVIVELDMTAKQEPEELTSAPLPIKPYDGLDNEAFKELVGKSKRPLGNIKLIDINEDQIMPDKDLWLTKALTDPDLAPKSEPQDSVDPTKKRKHHITYLAQQAKANEQELKSAWAAGKNNRMMSRSKYGF